MTTRLNPITTPRFEARAEKARRNKEAALAAFIGKKAEIDEMLARLAVDFIFSRPVFPTPLFVENSGIPRESAQRLLRLLRDGDNPILRTIRQGSGRRPAILAFPELLNIAEGRNVL